MKFSRTAMTAVAAATLVVGGGAVAFAQEPVDTTTTCDDFEYQVPDTDPAFHEGLDSDDDGIGCEANPVAPVTTTPETTTPETTSPETEVPETTPETVVPETEVPETTTPETTTSETEDRPVLESVPSGPVS